MSRLARAVLGGSTISVMACWSVLLATACSPASKGPVSPSHGTPSASSAAAMPPAVPADATAVEFEFEAAGCVVVGRDSPGSAYLAPKGREGEVSTALLGPVRSCFSQGVGRHGLMHVRVEVKADGSLSGVLAAPGGAMSNDLADCVNRALTKAKVAPPQGGGGTLMLFLTSTCADAG